MKQMVKMLFRYRCLFCLASILFVSQNAPAQTFQYTYPQLKEVSFSGTGYFEIKSDIDGTPYSTPHYEAAPVSKKPVGYVRNTKPKVTAKFSNDCNLPTFQILVRGDVNGVEAILPPILLGPGLVLEYPLTEATQSLPNQVDYFPAYQIEWKASYDNGSNWISIGTSENPVYVSLETPLPEYVNASAGYDYLWYQTLVHIGCEKGKGATVINDVLTGVWDHIKTLNVQRVHDGAPLHYYDSWYCSVYTSGGLIKTTDGQCGAWMRLLLDILKVHGFSETDNYTRIRPLQNYAQGFYVKTWTFDPGGGSTGIPDFPYLNLWASNPPFGPSGPFDWINPEVTDTSPTPGQSQVHPQSRFNFHFFPRILGEYYDPSYGVKYNTIPVTGGPDVDEVFSAYYIRVDLPPNFVPPYADIVTQNPSGDQILFELTTY